MIELSKKYVVLSEAISEEFGDKLKLLKDASIELGYSVMADDLIECCRILHDNDAFGFDMLMDVSGVDYLSYGRNEWETLSATSTGFSRGISKTDGSFAGDVIAETEYKPINRFAVVYHLLSVTNNYRLRLKVFCESDERPVADSVTGVWASADWYEREVFDLYGIIFRGHPDLRRILTDYGFIGHPFRKDFPLIGNVEMRYDSEKGRVVYQPVTIEPRTLVPKTIRDDNRYEPDLKDS
ncbi:MAG: NADH-quinone oxidoreductase subunit C [Gammaproteobacteria bacterium]|nr:NADH-quinone oxidoreductase subunit C [Gammaproteobacteria bacterium]